MTDYQRQCTHQSPSAIMSDVRILIASKFSENEKIKSWVSSPVIAHYPDGLFHRGVVVLKELTVRMLTTSPYQPTTMSSSDDGGPEVQVERLILSDDLNSTLLFIFGMGMP